MKISINGNNVETQFTVLSDILNEFGAEPPFAIAINGDFVPKSNYATTQVVENDLVDVVSPIFGG